MEKFCGWWKRDKRYITLVKSLLMALLPVLCCQVYCAMHGCGIGDVYLPCSEWNDELFYYKQVEGIVKHGYPLGYFGFNESHAMKLSFAAWSPVLVFPWILWGLIFGWNLMSPVLCNIVLMTLCCFAFVWLVKPDWKQLGVLALLFCLYTPFVRYMLSAMPEVICFSMLILFYSLAIHYLRRERTYELVLLFVLSGVMTLMRPYLVLFMLLPCFLWVQKAKSCPTEFRSAKWKSAAGSAVVLAAVLGMYAGIKHYLGAEYFAPLFFTDWISAFFEQGLFGGIRFTLGKLYYMGKDFFSHTLQGFRTGLASGAFFAGFLVCMCILLGQSVKEWGLLRRMRRENLKEQDNTGTEAGIGIQTGRSAGKAGTEAGMASQTGRSAGKAGTEAGMALQTGRSAGKAGTEAGMEQRQADGIRKVSSSLIIHAHLAFSFVAMLFALLLMYKLTEGSKHLLTFMAAAIFVIALMETKFYKKAVLLGVTFAYFYSYMAVDPYDYQVPFVQEERRLSVESWQEELAGKMVLDEKNVPGYENVVIWTLYDTEEGGAGVSTQWQFLYALPEGYGISCCMPDYVLENFETLRSRYICVPRGGLVEKECVKAGYVKLMEDEKAALYQRY